MKHYAMGGRSPHRALQMYAWARGLREKVGPLSYALSAVPGQWDVVVEQLSDQWEVVIVKCNDQYDVVVELASIPTSPVISVYLTRSDLAVCTCCTVT